MIVREAVTPDTPGLTGGPSAVLLADGNTYQTRVRVAGNQIELAQPRQMVALLIALMGVIACFSSPWLGAPLFAMAILYLCWVKEIRLDLDTREVRYRSGFPWFAREHHGTFDEIDDVTLHEAALRRGTGSHSASTGHWRRWDVTVNGFDGQLRFPVWEQSDEQQATEVARLLSSLFECKLKTIKPHGVIVSDGR